MHTPALVADDGPPTPPSSRSRCGLVDGVPVWRIELGDAAMVPLGPVFRAHAGYRVRIAIHPALHGNDGFDATRVWPVSLVDGDMRSLQDQHGHRRRSTDDDSRPSCLVAEQWNLLELDVDRHGERDVQIVLRCPQGEGRLWVQWLGTVPEALPRVPPVDRVRTTRGSHSSAAFSRGNTLPATALPHGFNLLTPVTDARSRTWLYQWHPEQPLALQALSISHQPSPWINDRSAVQMMPWRGEAHVDPERRAIGFSHDDELDRVHHYRVRLADRTVAEATPTERAAVFRFSFEGDEACGAVLDLPGEGWLEASTLPDGRVAIHGRMEPAPGFGRRHRDPVAFCYAETRQQARVLPQPSGGGLTLLGRGGRRQAVVLELAPAAGRVLEVSLATSFISVDQAAQNLRLEVGEAGFDEILARARAIWQELLGRLELPEASVDQQVTAWSSLARLHLWPSAMHENVGSAKEPQWVHASPFMPIGARARLAQRRDRTALPVEHGRLYVNHGYWDTYRTCWPAFALLDRDKAGELLDGILPAFTESGWMGRWSAPGHVDSMVGTSSDVVFADASAQGVGFDELTAYDSALRNACCPPPDHTVGRKGMGSARFRGWVASDEVPEAMSWTVENSICDAAIALWSERLAERAQEVGALRRRAEFQANAMWFTNRALGISHSFDPESRMLRGRQGSGVWSHPQVDPTRWGGDHTETTAWGMSVSIPQDGSLLARLHGGDSQLADHLDQLFATPERADNPGHYGAVIHEMREARALRMGQCALSNQPAHHVPFMYLHAGRPWRAQATVREALDRLFVGSEIGQGLPGDEDNGEMSAWWLLAAMGLYPLWPGSGEFVMGAPLTPMTWRRPEGTLRISTVGDGPYVHHVMRNGKLWPSVTIRSEELRGDVELSFSLTDLPGPWGVGERPSSLSTSSLGRRWGEHRSDRSGQATWSGLEPALAEALVDDKGERTVVLESDRTISVDWPEPWRPKLMTLTLARPGEVVLELGGLSGGHSSVLHARTQWADQTVALLLPETRAVSHLTIRPLQGVALRQVEFF